MRKLTLMVAAIGLLGSVAPAMAQTATQAPPPRPKPGEPPAGAQGAMMTAPTPAPTATPAPPPRPKPGEPPAGAQSPK